MPRQKPAESKAVATPPKPIKITPTTYLYDVEGLSEGMIVVVRLTRLAPAHCRYDDGTIKHGPLQDMEALAAYLAGSIRGVVSDIYSDRIVIDTFGDPNYDDGQTIVLHRMERIQSITIIGEYQQASTRIGNVELQIACGVLQVNGTSVSRAAVSRLALHRGWVYTSDPITDAERAAAYAYSTSQRDNGSMYHGCVRLTSAQVDAAIDWAAEQFGWW